MQAGGRAYHLEAVGPLSARMRMEAQERFLRPGATVSGPAMMALADYALYAAILANIGPVALAVTTSLTFNFLRKPAPGDLRGGMPAAQARPAAGGGRGPDHRAGGDAPRLPRHRDLLDPARTQLGARPAPR